MVDGQLLEFQMLLDQNSIMQLLSVTYLSANLFEHLKI